MTVRAIHHTAIALRPGRKLRLGVVADTHSAPHPGSVDHLRSLAPDAIIHAGDIGELEVLDSYRAIAPLLAIRGNIDVRADDLPDVIVCDLTDGGQVALRTLIIHIGVIGPKLRPEVARLAHEHRARLVVCGHSHVPFLGEDRGISVFNPGSVGPRRFTLPIVFGTIEVAEGKLRARHFDATTGQPWSP